MYVPGTGLLLITNYCERQKFHIVIPKMDIYGQIM